MKIDYDSEERDNLHVLGILNEMRRVGVESVFIGHLMEYCQRYEGLQDLMEMWYEDLKTIQDDVQQFKSKLREEVDRQGGISELARKTGIPQPSLSRFFSSNSMPRRTTLYKIAKALNLPESAIGFKWIR